MRRFTLCAVLLSLALPAFAQEPVGCDKFKWSLDNERALLSNPSAVASGTELKQALSTAVLLKLVPMGDAKLPTPPSRVAKSADAYAGFVHVPGVLKAGTYRVTLSAGAWVDVVQDGQTLNASEFSGATGCSGVRKSVKFVLSTSPLVLEISGVSAPEIAFVLSQDRE